eukprot:4173203-Pleurochrysis_carterae.AAC.1
MVSNASTPRYGAEPYIKDGLHYRGNRHHVKHSCRSDASDRVGGGFPIYPSISVNRNKRLSVTPLGVDGLIFALIPYLGPTYIANFKIPNAVGYTAIS